MDATVSTPRSFSNRWRCSSHGSSTIMRHFFRSIPPIMAYAMFPPPIKKTVIRDPLAMMSKNTSEPVPICVRHFAIPMPHEARGAHQRLVNGLLYNIDDQGRSQSDVPSVQFGRGLTCTKFCKTPRNSPCVAVFGLPSSSSSTNGWVVSLPRPAVLVLTLLRQLQDSARGACCAY